MNDLESILNTPYLISLVMLWTLVWKGVALWVAATKRQITWYVIILLINSLGIVEIAYVFYLSRYDLKSKQVLSYWHKRFSKKA